MTFFFAVVHRCDIVALIAEQGEQSTENVDVQEGSSAAKGVDNCVNATANFLEFYFRCHYRHSYTSHQLLRRERQWLPICAAGRLYKPC